MDNAQELTITNFIFRRVSVKSQIIIFLCSAVLICLPSPSKAQLTTDKEKFSYAVGLSVAKSLEQDGLTVEMDAFIMAIKDVLTGKEPKLSLDEMNTAIQAFQQKQQAQRQTAGAGNVKIGQAFLDANKSKPGVVTLPSGVQYKIIKVGSGKKPTLQNMVTVHYKGTLISGEEFDSSHKDNKPVSFRLNGLIQGWQVAIPLMPAGSTWRLFIPGEMAYGLRGSPPKIGPDETLIFDIELISVQ
jgi:FKBP-type peptidyl-prolyl cis-trans isomerase FklB